MQLNGHANTVEDLAVLDDGDLVSASQACSQAPSLTPLTPVKEEKTMDDRGERATRVPIGSNQA